MSVQCDVIKCIERYINMLHTQEHIVCIISIIVLCERIKVHDYLNATDLICTMMSKSVQNALIIVMLISAICLAFFSR